MVNLLSCILYANHSLVGYELCFFCSLSLVLLCFVFPIANDVKIVLNGNHWFTVHLSSSFSIHYSIQWMDMIDSESVMENMLSDT